MSAGPAPATLRAASLPALSGIEGLVHGFEQRPLAGPVEGREQAEARVRAALADFGRLHLMRQVHGAAVCEAPWDGRPEADAAVAGSTGVLLGILTADCLPILLVDPERRAVAVAHAGWRGSAQGVASAAVAALLQRGSRPENLIAALGPANNVCCYEVGDELRERFGAEAAVVFRPGPRSRPHLDVRLANVRQLERAGVAGDRIHHVADCTSCRPDLYPSYRRDGPGAGRMLSYVGFRS